MNNIQQTKEIKSLNGLRALVCLCIFTAHSHLMIRNCFSVAFFFTLSGFVLYYSWCNKIQNHITFKENTSWILKHMKKIYPIHVLLFMASIFIRWKWVISIPLKELIIKGLLNLTLLQSLTTDPYYFNQLSWYISALFILYWITLPLIKFVKNYSHATIKLITFIIVLLYIFDYYIVKYPNLGFAYSHPLYRVFDFVLGMLIAKLFLQYKKIDIPIDKINIYESIIVIVFTIMLIASYGFVETYNYFAVFFVPLLFVLAYDKGWLADSLKNKYIQKLASISFEFYMVHELIIFCVQNIVHGWNLHCSDVSSWRIVWIISLPIAIIFAKILHYLSLKLNQKQTTSNS